MTPSVLRDKAETYLHKLCVDIPTRRVGSSGNREATDFFAATVASFGLETRCSEFGCIDWTQGGAHLAVDGQSFDVQASPYTLGCRVRAPLAVASTVDELEALDVSKQIVLLHGELAKEQLMPKNFPFYNPDHHKETVRLLENKAPRAIVAATGRNPELAGGLYPFPLIEDGDFDIPSAFLTDVEGVRLAEHAGHETTLTIIADRIASTGCNVVARKGDSGGRTVVVCAHIDAKMGTPGAIDNAAGVVVLMLLAELLEDYSGNPGVEIVAFNGEDYYSAPGQVLYLRENAGRLGNAILGINLDGAGYHQGNTAYSLYGCPLEIADSIHRTFSSQVDTIEGEPWYQSDHSLFIQNGVPAVAITSDRFDELWTHVAHTPKDTPEIVDCTKLVATALSLRDLLLGLD